MAKIRTNDAPNTGKKAISSRKLASAGMVLDDAVQVQVFLTDLNDYAALSEIYSNYFKAPFPARVALQVARLPRDARVEIALIAVKRPGPQQPPGR